MHYFKDKKITVMGLGLLGRSVADIQYLVKHGAIVTVTDLKNKDQLQNSIDRLRDLDVVYHLAGHRYEDFENCDLVLKSAGISLSNPYILHAKKNNIRVAMDEELFMELKDPSIVTVGVTGTRGKTTTTYMISHILKHCGKIVYDGGNIDNTATLPLLDIVKKDEIVVLELSSWQLQGFHESRISPNIAIITNFYPDHLNYYDSLEQYWFDKTAIYQYQNPASYDICIASASLKELIKDAPCKPIFISLDTQHSQLLPELYTPGIHTKENAILAFCVAQELGCQNEKIGEALAKFKGPHGRLEHLQDYVGRIVYNDNSSTTPDATLMALNALEGPIVLLVGGTAKVSDYQKLANVINERSIRICALQEKDTHLLTQLVNPALISWCDNPSDWIDNAFGLSKAGDTILLSPAFASFGAFFANVYEREGRFLEDLKRYI